MKKLLTFLFFWFFVKIAFAQVSTITGQYLQDTNLLSNPGFESGIVKWSLTNGTMEVTNDASNLLQGKRSLKVTLSAHSLELYQDSISYANAIIGMQAKAGISIKTDLVGIEVCVRKNFITDTDCLPVLGDNKYHTYTIPFILDGISNGIVIKSSASLTGLVYFDEAYVGRSQEISYVLSDTIKLKYERDTAQTITSSPLTTAIYNQLIYDNSLSSYNTTTGIFTAPKNSYYKACGYWLWDSASWGVGQSMSMYIWDKVVYRSEVTTTNTDFYHMGGCNTVYLNEDETFAAVRVQQNSGTNKSNITNALYNFITIEEIADNEAIASQNITLSEQTANEFSAVVDSSGSVTNETFDFINGSCSKAGVGQFACTFNSNIFNNAPNLVATINSNSASCNVVQVFSIFPTGFSAYTKDASGTLSDCSFNIFAEKTGSDYNKSGVIVGKFKNINSTDLCQLHASRNDAETITADTEDIPFKTIIKDNCNTWSNAGNTGNNTNDAFTAPRSGRYLIDIQMLASTSIVSWNIRLMINGVYERMIALTENYSFVKGSASVDLSEGDVVTFRSTDNFTLIDNAGYHHLYINELPDYEAVVKNLYENVMKCQTKFLTSDLSANTNPITNLTFNNLNTSKYYSLSLNTSLVYSTGNTCTVTYSDGTKNIVSIKNREADAPEDRTKDSITNPFFKPSSSSLTASFAENTACLLEGNSTYDETYATLCELPISTVQTTEW